MNNTQFKDGIMAQIKRKQSHICVGLDSDFAKIPESIKKKASVSEAIFLFNKEIVDATHDSVVAYKPNLVFYAAYGDEGLEGLRRTTAYIREKDASLKIIADCKRSEMGRTAEMAARELFDDLQVDALTVTPWFGLDTVEPYQRYPGKAAFVLCHDSNPSAPEVQDVKLESGKYLYEYVTELVCKKWNTSGNILMEGPLTYPQQLKRIYELSDENQFFLIAGLGGQGGDINDLAIFKERLNFIISASRSIIFASTGNDFAEASRKQILDYKKRLDQLLYV